MTFDGGIDVSTHAHKKERECKMFDSNTKSIADEWLNSDIEWRRQLNISIPYQVQIFEMMSIRAREKCLKVILLQSFPTSIHRSSSSKISSLSTVLAICDFSITSLFFAKLQTEQIYQEIRLIQSMSHPNIVKVTWGSNSATLFVSSSVAFE